MDHYVKLNFQIWDWVELELDPSSDFTTNAKTHILKQKTLHIPKSHLCWRLKPTNKAMVFAELIHFDAIVAQFPALITLISQKHSSNPLSISQHYFRIQVFLPLNDGLKGGWPCHIEHNEGAHGFAVVHPRHVPKSFLTCDEHMHSQSHALGLQHSRASRWWDVFIVFLNFFPEVYLRQLETRQQSAGPVFQWNNTFL